MVLNYIACFSGLSPKKLRVTGEGIKVAMTSRCDGDVAHMAPPPPCCGAIRNISLIKRAWEQRTLKVRDIGDSCIGFYSTSLDDWVNCIF